MPQLPLFLQTVTRQLPPEPIKPPPSILNLFNPIADSIYLNFQGGCRVEPNIRARRAELRNGGLNIARGVFVEEIRSTISLAFYRWLQRGVNFVEEYLRINECIT
jgi:hypothetical protein